MTAFRIVVVACVGLCSTAVLAQTPVPGAGTADAANSSQGSSATKPGGARDSQKTGLRDNQTGNAANNPNATENDNQTAGDENPDKASQGPEIVDDPNATPEQKASAEYSGPAVLSRGISASEPMNPKNIRFTPSLGLEAVYTSGLTGVSFQQNGQLANDAAGGIQLSYGLTGEKVYKKDIFSLTFAGNLYHYPTLPSYDGSDNQLSVTWRHSLSRHLSFGVRESFQEYTRNNLLLSGSTLINSGLGTTLVTSNPLTEAFNGRVLTLLNEGDLTYQATARLSISLSGGGFLTRRASTSLYGDTGYQAGADIAYRFTRRMTAGVYYSYTHFDFIGIYGGTDINTTGFTYSYAFNPSTELITRIGASRVETTGLQSVAVDPFIAQLLGTPSTLEALRWVNYAPDFNAQIRRKRANVEFSLAYARGMTPGNGIILTSVMQTGSVGANMKARRYWNFSLNTGYDSLSSFGATTQKYASLFGTVSVYRKIHRDLDWHVRADYHHYTFDSTGFLRNSFIFATGVVWSPGDILDRLW